MRDFATNSIGQVSHWIGAVGLLMAIVVFSGVASATDGDTKPAPVSTSVELVMFEEFGCEWCERWLEEIGPIYPLTSEGKFAPLRRVYMSDERPEDLQGIRGISFSPTFVVMKNGEEVGRVIGYPGQDFFWPLLDEVLLKAGMEPAT